MEAYKTEFNIGPGLNDDYIKFFRYAESLIQEVDKGMLLFITNSSFIKSQAAQEMRKSLLSTFDEIYIINLNGNKNKQDKNVFNIKTETCITILIKTNQKEKNSLAKVFYEDLIGSAEFKFDWLNNNPFQVEGV
jgi:predicted helicase